MMWKSIKGTLSKLGSALVDSRKDNNTIPKATKGVTATDAKKQISISLEKATLSKRLWKKDYKPLRQIVLWGRDELGEPSLLIFYGRQNFTKYHNGQETYNVLDEDVTYTSWAVFTGKRGHLPSFEAVKIIEGGSYREGTDNSQPRMYYKKGLKYDWTWRVDHNYRVSHFGNLEAKQQFTLPHYAAWSYEDCVRQIEEKKINFLEFKLVRNPNEILGLDESLSRYYGLIVELLGHYSLYTRKKRLRELTQENPPKEVYIQLLKVGSPEVLSGLFLELAKKADPIILKEVDLLTRDPISWAEESYGEGVKRCAKIYLSAVTPELRAQRINWINQYLPSMDLHLISLSGKEFPQDKILEGMHYRKYAISGLLMDYYQRYNYSERRYERETPGIRYPIGPYSDGVTLNFISFKNTLQECEIYGMAEAIGKIAYYLDAPRLTYYLQGSNKAKVLKYLRRYIRRIIDGYARNNPPKFMEAMKAMLTSYTPYDYVCKFRGNFQFNELLKHYLYGNFNEKPPIARWDHWQERYDWMSNDQHMRLEGRYEWMKEVWDEHLSSVAEIACKAQIPQITKACYYILKDSPRTEAFIESMSYQKLSELASTSYEPLANLFMMFLTSKVQAVETFDSHMMLELMKSPNQEVHQCAVDYFQRTKGAFSAAGTADMLLLDNLGEWTEVLGQSLTALDEAQYVAFITYIAHEKERFSKVHIALDEDIMAMLIASVSQIQQTSSAKKTEVILALVNLLINESKLASWLELFLEEIIFSFSKSELEALLQEVHIEATHTSVAVRNSRMLAILSAIKYQALPTDAQIINILESGTSKMISMLIDIIMPKHNELNDRFSTLLIMLEADILILNKKAEEIFETMPEDKQRKLHAIIIDSPVQKVYKFGLEKLDAIYGELIPEAFIIQMLEHSALSVKEYISDKMNKRLEDLGNGSGDIFMYYVKTLLLLPNKISKGKDKIYEVLPKFVLIYKDKLEEIESILLDIGGSNSIKDSERALVTLAKIRGEVMSLEG